MNPVKLDNVDRRLLAELQRDGRIPVAALADKVGLTPTPCLRRLRRLEKDGVIKGYTAVIDPERIGRALQAFIEVSLVDHTDATVAEFRRAVGQHEEVVACYFMTGDVDFLLHVMVPDLETFSRFSLSRLTKLPGVKGTRSSIVLETLKPAFGLPTG